jgi:hypothetical protein
VAVCIGGSHADVRGSGGGAMSQREALAEALQQFWQGPSGRSWNAPDDEKSCCALLPSQADWFRRLADVALTNVVERCAKVADEYDGDGMDSTSYEDQLGDARQTRSDIAEQIRAMVGEKHDAS